MNTMPNFVKAQARMWVASVGVIGLLTGGSPPLGQHVGAGAFANQPPAPLANFDNDYQPPVANAGRDFAADLGLPAKFQGYGASANFVIVQYEWDFDGDGVYDYASSATGITEHTYASAGTYEAVLKVTDSQGGIARDRIRVGIRTGVGKQEFVTELKQVPAIAKALRPGEGVKQRYAVMINGGSEDRFWNDVKFMYSTLVDVYQYASEQVYVLNNAGPGSYDPEGIVDLPATRSAVTQVFTELTTQMDDDDMLFVWVTDHGRGYQGPTRSTYGYVDSRVRVGADEEQDYLEADYKLRSWFCPSDIGGASGAGNMGMNRWCVKDSVWYNLEHHYLRSQYLSHFTALTLESGLQVTDNDIAIERLTDYVRGDFNQNGVIEYDLGERLDYDQDNVPPYDSSTGIFDEDDWGNPDVLDDDFNQIDGLFRLDTVNDYQIFDIDLDNRLDIDLNPVQGVLDIDATDVDNQGLFDGIDLNDDGDRTDWVNIDEALYLSGEDLFDDELAALVAPLSTNPIIFFMEQCFSGGFVFDLSAPSRVIATASIEESVSFGNLFVEEFTAAIREQARDESPINADVNHDARVSILEAFNYAASHDYYDETPQYDDNGDRISQAYPVPAGGDGAFGSATFLGGYARPKLISPPDGASATAPVLTQVNTRTPFFIWDAQAPVYVIEVDDDPTFGSPLIQANASWSTYNADPSIFGAIPATTYYWRVRAIYGDGSASAWSDIWRFEILAQEPVSQTTWAGTFQVSYMWSAMNGGGANGIGNPANGTSGQTYCGKATQPWGIDALPVGIYRARLIPGANAGWVNGACTTPGLTEAKTVDDYWWLVSQNNPLAVKPGTGFKGGLLDANPSNLSPDWFSMSEIWVGPSPNQGARYHIEQLGDSTQAEKEFQLGQGETIWFYIHDWYTADNLGGATVELWRINTPQPEFILDRFDRTAGPLGSQWSGSEGLGGYQILGQKVDVIGGGPIYWFGPDYGVEQQATVRLTTIDPKPAEHGLLLKVQGNPPDWHQGYIGVYYLGASHQVQVSVFRPSEGKWTDYAPLNVDFKDGDRLAAKVLSNGRVRIYRNGELVGVVRLNAKDARLYNGTGGRIGLWFNAYGTAMDAWLDNFGGGSVPLAALMVGEDAVPIGESEDGVPVIVEYRERGPDTSRWTKLYLPMILAN